MTVSIDARTAGTAGRPPADWSPASACPATRRAGESGLAARALRAAPGSKRRDAGWPCSARSIPRRSDRFCSGQLARGVGMRHGRIQHTNEMTRIVQIVRQCLPVSPRRFERGADDRRALSPQPRARSANPAAYSRSSCDGSSLRAAATPRRTWLSRYRYPARRPQSSPSDGVVRGQPCSCKLCSEGAALDTVRPDATR